MIQAIADALGCLGVKIDPVIPVGDLLSFVVIFGTLLVGIVSLRNVQKSIEQANKAAKSSHYSELDRFYADLLKLAMEDPRLRKPQKLASDRSALDGHYRPFQRFDPIADKYDIYAFMIWNFIETIHDRCLELCDSHDDEGYASLKGTWQPIIVAEDNLHRGWILSEMGREKKRPKEEGERRDKFCVGFCNFVLDRQWQDDDWTYQDKTEGPLIGMS